MTQLRLKSPSQNHLIAIDFWSTTECIDTTTISIIKLWNTFDSICHKVLVYFFRLWRQKRVLRCMGLEGTLQSSKSQRMDDNQLSKKLWFLRRCLIIRLCYVHNIVHAPGYCTIRYMSGNRLRMTTMPVFVRRRFHHICVRTEYYVVTLGSTLIHL